MGKLENFIEENVKNIMPVIENTMHKYLGVSIVELNEDLTSKLKNPLINIKIYYNLGYKDAKRKFKSAFVKRLLQVNLANVSEAARVADVDRRSIHRIIKNSKIDIDKIRKELIKPSYIRMMAVSDIVGSVLKNYTGIINPVKLSEMYENVDNVSKDIASKLPKTSMTLKDAEKYFDKEYLKHHFNNEKNLAKLAKKIGLRYETLYRKIKKLGIS